MDTPKDSENPEQNDRTLTNRQGHPITNNQSSRTVGSRGPATLENYQFLEKITHFDRERIPERVVHARGFVCYGEDPAGHSFLHRHRRARLVRGGARPARVRGEILH
jgi:catalase